MKKLLLILGIVSASFAFATDCPMVDGNNGFIGTLFISNAPPTVQNPDGYIGHIECLYSSGTGIWQQGNYTVNQPDNYHVVASEWWGCSNNNPNNCSYTSTNS